MPSTQHELYKQLTNTSYALLKVSSKRRECWTYLSSSLILVVLLGLTPLVQLVLLGLVILMLRLLLMVEMLVLVLLRMTT